VARALARRGRSTAPRTRRLGTRALHCGNGAERRHAGRIATGDTREAPRPLCSATSLGEYLNNFHPSTALQ
jgi:hypothetical protein